MAEWKKVLLEGDAAVLTSSTPLTINASAGTVGVSTAAARADHRHQVEAGAAGSMVTCDAGAAGAGTGDKLARIDHKHTISAGAAGSMVAGLDRTANNAGTGTAFARIDHRHVVSLKLNSVATAAAIFKLYKASAEPSASAPTAGTGRFYYNTADDHLYVYVP